MNLWFCYHSNCSEFKEFNNRMCQVVRQLQYPEVDQEILLFEVRFTNGDIHTAWPDELELVGCGDEETVRAWLTNIAEINGEVFTG